MKWKLFLLALALVPCLYGETVHLDPPILTPDAAEHRTHCTRPMRSGKFNISVTRRPSGKIVTHCYGHGGSGWTTLFGSVNQAIDQFEAEVGGPEQVDEPIHVIGAGCMGLLSAVELTTRGYRVSQVTAKELWDLPSWNAAGYFALVSVKTSPEEQENLDKIGIRTFLAYKAIDEGQHLYLPSDCVTFMPVYYAPGTHTGIEELEARGYLPPSREVTIDFGNGVRHEGYREGWTYMLNTTRLLEHLHSQVEECSIQIVEGEVESFEEVDERLIFNCAGLGARQLNNDEAMIPVRGHLVMLTDEAEGKPLDYMIYTTVEQEGREEYIYLFPRTSWVSPAHRDGLPVCSCLGGTFIPNVDTLSEAELEELDSREFRKMLDRSHLFFHGTLYPW